MGSRPNIVFIVIDAARASNFGYMGYSKPTTSNVDRIAKKGIVFERCFSCTSATDPSLTSIFSGKYPVSHGIISHGERITKDQLKTFNATGTKLLPEILSRYGYLTGAVDWLGRWHKRGYHVYTWPYGSLANRILKFVKRIAVTFLKYSGLAFPLSRLNLKLVADAVAVTRCAIDFIRYAIKRSSEPFFLFIHYWDTHTPYRPPRQYYEEFARFRYEDYKLIGEILKEIKNPFWRNYLKLCIGDAKSTGQVLARYDACLAFVDEQIGKLYNYLEEEGIIDDTLLILTSDHGESLTEHGIYFAHHGLYDVNVHVPLIMVYPREFEENKRISAVVQHIDLMPTILDIIGLEMQEVNYIDGKSLLPLVQGDATKIHDFILLEEAYTERKIAIRTERFKYIRASSEKNAVCRHCWKIHGGLEELYDISQDPKEEVNLVRNVKYMKIKKVLEKKLLEEIKELERRRIATILKRRLHAKRVYLA